MFIALFSSIQYILVKAGSRVWGLGCNLIQIHTAISELYLIEPLTGVNTPSLANIAPEVPVRTVEFPEILMQQGFDFCLLPSAF